MPSLSSQLEIVVESQDLFQANYAIFPSIGSSLLAKEPLDHEANATLQVRVRATDEHNASVEKKFTIDISDEFDDPGKWNKTLAPDRQRVTSSVPPFRNPVTSLPSELAKPTRIAKPMPASPTFTAWRQTEAQPSSTRHWLRPGRQVTN